MKLLSVLALIVAAAAVAIAANLALLSYASTSNDPVGKLSPLAPEPAAPAKIILPQRGPVEGGEADD